MRTKPRPATEKKVTDLAEVKRRFIRQNRELAKNNSAQSLKIRSLENEVSKLLAHNLELRERNLGLEHRLENATDAAVHRVKRELKAKLEELSGLVDGLHDGNDEYRRESVDRDRVLSPSHQQYRERQPLGDLMRDSQMPTISEDRMFPRQSMDPADIRAMRISDGSAATGSPDLGPPPVARFDCEGEDEGAAKAGSQESEDDLLPSVNLETRRRRKDGASEREIRRSSILALSPVKLSVEPAATSMLRTGAKRKLADRDADKTAKPSSKSDFAYIRKPVAEVPAMQETEGQETPAVKQPAQENQPTQAATSPKPARKVLGDKSVNMSPRKVAAAKPTKSGGKAEDLVKAKPAPRAVNRPASRGRRVSSMPELLHHDEPVVSSIELPLPDPVKQDLPVPPKTPAALAQDLFSPHPSEPSASQPAPSRDTPPPSDLSSLSNTTTDARPSRRARSSVNYAEPSLVAKMRRPGKGMVDAISGLQAGARRSISADVTVVQVKMEPVEDEEGDIWAKRNGSPLRERSTTSDSSSITGDKIAVASRTVAAPRRESVVAKRRQTIRADLSSTSPPCTVAETAEKLAELDLYDFKESSSSPAGDVGPGLSKVTVGKRRHSSVLKEQGAVVHAGSGSKTSAARTEAGKTAGGRRKSMML